jgi:type I restriction enzyme S subunit
MSHYKPYPAYRASGLEWIGQVPEHWAVKPICRVASCNDDSLPENLQPDQMLRYVDISSVNHTDGIAGVTEIRFADAPSRARRRAKTGDVVISTVRTYLKAVAAVTEPYADCTYSTGFAVLRPRPSEVVPEFLKWLALNDLVIQAIEAHSEGLSYPAINPTELVKLKVVLPPSAEQTAIAAAIDRETACIDALIAKKTRFIELLQEKRQALITHAVTKGLDPDVKMKDSGVEWIGEVPEHWSVVQVRHVANLGSGHTPSRSRPDWWEDCYIPWFTLADIWQVRREGRRFVHETEETVSDLGIDNSVLIGLSHPDARGSMNAVCTELGRAWLPTRRRPRIFGFLSRCRNSSDCSPMKRRALGTFSAPAGERVLCARTAPRLLSLDTSLRAPRCSAAVIAAVTSASRLARSWTARTCRSPFGSGARIW